MGTTLHTLAPNPGATRKKKRVGRGPGSGYGKTAGRGQKGQKSRAGHHGSRVGFEGGQMPMQRRLPKRGFTNPFRVEAHAVNLGAIATKLSERDGVISLDDLRNAGLVPKKANLVKILADGEFNLKVTLQAHRFSKSALAKLAAAGSKAEIVGKDGSTSAAPLPEAAAADGGEKTATDAVEAASKPATTDTPTEASATAPEGSPEETSSEAAASGDESAKAEPEESGDTTNE